MLSGKETKILLDGYVRDYKKDNRNESASAVLMRGMVMGAVSILWLNGLISYAVYKSYLKKVDAGYGN